jgi:3-dehydroquinate dehydratase-2
MRLMVLNGVNLGRLGLREPEIYGTTTHDQLAAACRQAGTSLDAEVEVRQTDSEAELIGWLYEAFDAAVPVVLNPGAWGHYSYALRDAVSSRTVPLVEVHLSNLAAREPFRHTSVLTGVADGVIAGLGAAGYLLALQYLADRARTT